MLRFLSKTIATFSLPLLHSHRHTNTQGRNKRKAQSPKTKQQHKNDTDRETTIEIIINYTHSRAHGWEEERGEGRGWCKWRGGWCERNTRKRKGNTHEIAIYIKFICTQMHAHTHLNTLPLVFAESHMHAQIKFIQTHNETTLAGTWQTCGQKG